MSCFAVCEYILAQMCHAEHRRGFSTVPARIVEGYWALGLAGPPGPPQWVAATAAHGPARPKGVFPQNLRTHALRVCENILATADYAV